MLDTAAAAWVQAHRTPALTLLMLAVTHSNATFALCAYSSVFGWLLYRRGQRRWMLALALAVPLGLAMNVGLKHLFRRTRPVPDDALMSLSTYSFPSGHTAGAMLFYGVIAAYAISRTTRHRVRVAWVAAWLSAVGMVASSRVYLGVHYLSDVLAASAWSLAWLATALLTASRVRFPGERHGG